MKISLLVGRPAIAAVAASALLLGPLSAHAARPLRSPHAARASAAPTSTTIASTVTLSNGVVLTLGSTIDTSVVNIFRVHYRVGIPRGVEVTNETLDTAVKGRETIDVVYDTASSGMNYVRAGVMAQNYSPPANAYKVVASIFTMNQKTNFSTTLAGTSGTTSRSTTSHGQTPAVLSLTISL